MKSSSIVKTIFPVFVLIFLVLSFFILIRGHQLPGGGFIAGLIAGSVLSLSKWAKAPDPISKLPISGVSMIFLGLAISVVSGLIGPSTGQNFFQGVWLKFPIVGKLGTPVLFDFGVYFVVIGFCTSLTTALLQESEDPT